MHNRRNFYRVLQVQPDAPHEIIKASYRTLMQKLKAHPDLGGDQWNAAVINEAYAVLSNPGKRAKYDTEQLQLRKSVGADARASAPEPQSEPDQPEERAPGDVAEEDLAAPSPPSEDQTNDPLLCTFCRTRTPSGDYQAPDEVCRGCGSPMRLIEATNTRDRSARRIEHQGMIHFRVDASRPGAYSANVVNLSPTGLRFISKHRLRRGCVVKLESPTLSAVASVTHCSPAPARGQFATGVKFLTLKLLRARGTFVSAKA